VDFFSFSSKSACYKIYSVYNGHEENCFQKLDKLLREYGAVRVCVPGEEDEQHPRGEFLKSQRATKLTVYTHDNTDF